MLMNSTAEPVFLTLLLKLLPIYVSCFMGWVAGRYCGATREGLANMLFYMFNPLIILHGIMHCEFSLAVLSLPLVVSVIATFTSLLVYFFTSLIYKDKMRNVIAFSSGGSSAGYFGLPVAVLIFDENTVALYIACAMGIMIFENSCGFYLMARGQHTKEESIKKFMKLPTLYTGVIGFVLIACGYKLPEFVDEFMYNMRITYTMLGLMIIGIGLATIKSFRIHWGITFMTLITKYMLWPIMVALVIFIDKNIFHFYDDNIYKCLIILAIIPISVTNTILANVFNYPSDEIMLMVALNVLIAFVHVPLMIMLFLS